MERLDKLIDRFKEYQESHPNIANLWINYMEIKKEKFELLIIEGEKIMNLLNRSQDLPLETVLLLITLKQQMERSANIT